MYIITAQHGLHVGQLTPLGSTEEVRLCLFSDVLLGAR